MKHIIALVASLIVVAVSAVAFAQATAPIAPVPTPPMTQIVAPPDYSALIYMFATALGAAIAKGFWDGYQRRKEKAEAAAAKVVEKEAKEAKNAVLDATPDKAVTTATMNFKLPAAQARRIAQLTNDPQDIAAAELAETLLREQEDRS